MSSNLRAEPVNRAKLDLGTKLKFALRKRFSEPIDIIASSVIVPYLEGLMDAGTENLKADANKLIDFIVKHGEVILKEEY